MRLSWDTFRRQFRWKLLLLRFLVNGLALLLIAILVPSIYFVDKRVVTLLFAGAILGVLNAFVKPVIQFFTLNLLFASYGLVVVVINALMLGLLSRLFPGTIAIDGILWALIGGALIGIVTSFFENLLGVSPPFLLLAAERARHEAPREPKPGLMGFLVGSTPEKTTSEVALASTEVSDETVDAGQGSGKSAPSTGL